MAQRLSASPAQKRTAGRADSPADTVEPPKRMSTDTPSGHKSSAPTDETTRQLTDKQILDAIARADARAVNGLPDGTTVAEEIGLNRKAITERVNQMDDKRVSTHRSVVPGQAAVLTFELEGDR